MRVNGLLAVAFADDLNLICEAGVKKKLIESFVQTGRYLKEWCNKAGQMSFHQKSQMMQFGGKDVRSEWCRLQEGVQIEKADSKYLGIFPRR